MTVKEIIVAYLRKNNGCLVTSTDIETGVTEWARLRMDKVHNPGTYSRTFREMRADGTLVREKVYLQEEWKGVQKAWRVRTEKDQRQAELFE